MVFVQFLFTGILSAQPCGPVTRFIPYGSPGFRYLVVPNVGSAPSGWEQPAFDDSSWSLGCAAFGAGNVCFPVCSPWPIGSAILLRRTFSPLCAVTSAEVGIAIDNDAQVWINGQDITGYRPTEDCASPDKIVVSFDPRLLVPSNNLVAVLGVDRGGDARLDVEVRGTGGTCCPCFVLGPGHQGGGLLISCVTPPRLGTVCCVSFSDPTPAGLSYLYLGPGPALNPPLLVVGALVCAPVLYYVALPLVVLERGGNPAAFCIPIPGEPVLVGANFVLQGAALELAGCFRATDGLSVTVQQ
jgi:hypothetical protein